MKNVCMIPARLRSKRITKKNLRLLGGRPLISYVIEAAKASRYFDEIYVNSEADVFQKIALEHNVRFYHRDAALAGDAVQNHAFLSDFMANIKADIIVQINPTSPFITATDIQNLLKEMHEGGYSTVLSVKSEQIECICQGRPVNFNPTREMLASQDLPPLFLFTAGMMAWKVSDYVGTYGVPASTGYFVLDGAATLDIDTEQDWRLAEATLASMVRTPPTPLYYGEARDGVESDVPAILSRDGVAEIDIEHENQTFFNVNNFLASFADIGHSWARRVINTDSNSATLICQYPGEGNRLHHHRDWDEWWLILKGSWIFTVEHGDGQFLRHDIHEGDLVFIPRGCRHKITAAGTGPAVRLAVSRADVEHVYA